MKKTQMLYKVAATFGRFNIPHRGHVELIQQMLNHGEIAHVHVSGGGNNNNWDFRVLMLRQMCHRSGVDLSRVKFLNSSNLFTAVSDSVAEAEFNEVVFVIGSDQVDLAQNLADKLDVPFVINGRSFSSTTVRHFLDQTKFFEDAVNLYNGDSFAASLALVLRHEETSNVKVECA
jgi:cytidyltransferase-like protein